MRKLAPGLFAVSALVASLVASPAAQAAGPSAAQLLAELTSCQQISSGKYRSDSETAANIPVCGKNGAVWYKADLDIDCDGQRTSKCNENTDPWFQPDTAFHDSKGKPLVADKLPYVVVPSASGTWDYRKFGIQGGGVVAVIYNNRVEYAVVGDTGPKAIIGEASYAAAVNLGINPNPESGGTDGPVHYLYFKNSKVSPIEDHGKATSQGEALAQKFLNEN
ncbi:glycoside hydrolase family 75 protein [Lentzea rhizosphaerae]|uniref:Glycoside hydrolase family 75 protein n=1 Tax=Lentzea rhizosphaerae TaxID=2041025 RepID=A0ABV8BS05_9PSEU